MSMLRPLTAALFVLTSSHAAAAQVLQKNALTLEGAKRVLAAAESEAKRQNFPCSIAIVDEGGNLLAMERLDDWIIASANVSIGKARTSAIFRRPTSDFETIIKNGRTAMVALKDFTPLQGGVPITYGGKVIGAIGVSGNNPPKDEEIALAGANALGASGAVVGATTPAVSYWAKDEVAAAFAKGAVLFDGDKGARNYMVHASRRDGAGMAELHELDTDIIYVLGGTARFITGGAVVDGKPTVVNEVRGSGIKDGETRTIAKGDVLIVPHGTPHQFAQVSGPLTYYVVKVR